MLTDFLMLTDSRDLLLSDFLTLLTIGLLVILTFTFFWTEGLWRPAREDLPCDERGLWRPASGGLPRLEVAGLMDLAGLKDLKLFLGVEWWLLWCCGGLAGMNLLGGG